MSLPNVFFSFSVHTSYLSGWLCSFCFSCRRYEALYISKHVLVLDGDIDELAGHVYLFLKEQLERSTVPPPFAILRGTMIGLILALAIYIFTVFSVK